MRRNDRAGGKGGGRGRSDERGHEWAKGVIEGACRVRSGCSKWPELYLGGNADAGARHGNVDLLTELVGAHVKRSRDVDLGGHVRGRVDQAVGEGGVDLAAGGVKKSYRGTGDGLPKAPSMLKGGVDNVTC